IGGGGEFLRLHRVRDRLGRDILDVRLARVEPVDGALVDVEPDDAIPRAHELHGERETDVAEPHDAEDGTPVARLGDQRVDGRTSGAHRVTGAPPAARERDAASSTWTTWTPSLAPARGASVPRATRTKCVSSAASGSTLGRRGMKMSPSR